jgi:hypothetical protein
MSTTATGYTANSTVYEADINGPNSHIMRTIEMPEYNEKDSLSMTYIPVPQPHAATVEVLGVAELA